MEDTLEQTLEALRRRTHAQLSDDLKRNLAEYGLLAPTQTIHNVPSNMFAQNENRRVPGRLQNGKLSNDPSWFGMAAGNAPGLSAPATQSRTTPGMASFAQTIGGQQRPLDLSEFPSLGGGAQAQQQNPGATQGTSYWANNIRPSSPDRSSFLRGYGRGSGRARAPEDPTPGSTFAPGTEGYHFGARQANLNQLSGLAQQQTVVSLPQPRLGPTSPAGEDSERPAASSVIGGARFVDSRDDSNGGGPLRGGRTVANPFPNHQDILAGPVGYQGRSAPTQDQISNPDATNSSPQRGGHKGIADMTPEEKFGMPGLMAKLDPKNADFNQFARGMDLTLLGLNLESSEPLIDTFGSPFDDRPVVPEYKLPDAYHVTNVPPLLTQMQSFTDETLVMIFYENPRDIQQQWAAEALCKRDWRWHTELRQWMQKDPASPPPTRINEKQERGWYIFFDVNNWRRERREFVLDYDLMHPRMQPTDNTVAGRGGPPHGLGMGFGGTSGF